MLADTIIATIESIAPLAGASSWDRSGVQVAARRAEVERLAVALDPTPATVRAALERGAQFIHTHHPLSLKPDLPCRLDRYHEVLSLLLRADVCLYSAHTSLDVRPDGPAGWLCRHLGLVHPSILEVTGEDAGFGLAGDLPRPFSLRELLAKLARRIDLSTATVSGPVPDTISRVGYCTGSGTSLLPEAVAAGCELFITGDVKYHTALDTTIGLLDVGHHSLEEEMMRVQCELLARRLPGVDVFFVPSRSPMRRAADF